MKATAERIGNSSKERILIDGEVFIKSTTINKWNFIVVVETDKGEYFGKSGTRDAANKWTPFSMSVDSLHPSQVHPEHREEYKKYWDEAIAKGAVITTAGSRGFRQKVARLAIKHSRKVYKIER